MNCEHNSVKIQMRVTVHSVSIQVVETQGKKSLDQIDTEIDLARQRVHNHTHSLRSGPAADANHGIDHIMFVIYSVVAMDSRDAQDQQRRKSHSPSLNATTGKLFVNP